MVSIQLLPETADIETSSADYATRFTGPAGLWLLNVQTQATLAMLADYPQAKILEVGGGHGQLTSHLIKAGHSVTVIGSDESCKERVRALIESKQCEFQVGNVLDMPYADKAFDVVISYRFLAHVKQWQAFISELARVADKAVIIDYPTLRSVNYITPLLFPLKKRVEGNTRPYTYYKETELMNYAKSLGLSTGDRYAQFFWPVVFHRMLKRPKVSALLERGAGALGLSKLFGSPVITKFVQTQSK